MRQSPVGNHEGNSLERGIIESSRDCIKLLDRQGRLCFMSCAGQRMLEIEDIAPYVGESWIDIWPNAYRDAAAQAVAQAAGGEVGEFVGFCPTATGKPKWWDVLITPLNDGSEVPERLLAISRDITESKKAEALLLTRLRLSELAREEGLELLTQTAIDEAERLTDSQIGYFHFVDDDQENVTIQTWSASTLSCCEEQIATAHYPISKAGVWIDCLHARTPVIHNDYPSLGHKKGLPQGHPPLLRDLAVPIIREGRVAAIMGVGNKQTAYTREDVDLLQDIACLVMDLAARKQAEAALVHRTEELERINAELEQFAYVASHDLKAPLRGVANLALMIDEDAMELDPENRQRLRLLRERVMGMHQLIEGLLGYAGLGQAPHEPTAVSLGELLDEVIAALAVPPGFRVEWEQPLPQLIADPVQLRQIFQNLINNAIDHHDRSNGSIHIRALDGGGVWYLEVADDGPGIPILERERVFRMFSTGLKPGHSGIGLAVVRKLVTGNGGRIEALDNHPRGTLFRIAWPK